MQSLFFSRILIEHPRHGSGLGPRTSTAGAWSQAWTTAAMSGENRGTVTWHPNPGRNGIGGPHEPRTGGPAPTPGAGPFPAAVASPQWGALSFSLFGGPIMITPKMSAPPRSPCRGRRRRGRPKPPRSGANLSLFQPEGCRGVVVGTGGGGASPRVRTKLFRVRVHLSRGWMMFDSTLDNILRKQPEIKGFWAGPPHQQGPGLGPRHGQPQPCPGGIGAPLPGTRIPVRRVNRVARTHVSWEAGGAAGFPSHSCPAAWAWSPGDIAGRSCDTALHSSSVSARVKKAGCHWVRPSSLRRA